MSTALHVLDTISGPADIRELSVEEMKQLVEEMRQGILQKDSDVGGHVGLNLGVVELTIAFHYVFGSPKDKIVWDISHQSYSHKPLTGRKNGFEKGHYHEVSGYSNQHESEHDYFTVGHTSTSTSLATGLAKSKDLKKGSGNVVASIGDGPLSGSLALEGPSNGGALQANLIVLVNDNETSIDENHSSLYQNLAEFRQTHGESSNNLFKAIEFDYRYVDGGDDLGTVIRLFEEVKDIDHPVVLHVHTEKGRGYQPAVDNEMKYHWHVPFDLSTGEAKQAASGETFNTIIMDYLDRKVQASTAPITTVSTTIPGAFGLKIFQEKHPDHYFDVGIAEQHSITFASVLAFQGVRPVVFQSSTFLQRVCSQSSHDLTTNENPVIILVGGGTISANDRTHQGTFDIPYLSSIPNIKYLAPATKEDMISMLDRAFEQTAQPVAIRVPIHGVEHGKVIANDYSIPAYQTVNEGEKVVILALGGFLGLGKETVEASREKGIKATLINPRTIIENGVETLDGLKEAHELVITLGDGSLSGGFGERISRCCGDSSMYVLNFGAKKKFTDSVPTVKLYERYHLIPSQIVEDSLRVLNIQQSTVFSIRIIVYTSIWMVFIIRNKGVDAVTYQEAEEYLRKFQEKYPRYQLEGLGFFSFGDTEEMANELNGLVVKKIKIDTSSGYDLCRKEKEPLSKAGQLDVVLNGKSEPVCIIKNINVTILPLSEITEEHARKKGEGDRTLAYWWKVHTDFSKHACKGALNMVFTEEKLTVYEEFEVIFF